MAVQLTQDTAGTDERLYVRGRIVANLALLLLVPMLPDSVSRTLPLVLALVVTAGTGYVLAHSRIGSVADAMLRVFVVDVLAFGGFTYVFRDFDDGFYPAIALLVVVHALIVERHQAWMMGGLAAAAYAAGYTFERELTAGDFLQFAFKTVAILLLAVFVASSVERRRAREAETRQAVAERDDINALLQRRIAELQAVAQITETIHSSLDLEGVGPVVLDILSKALRVESCCLFVIDREKSDTLFSASVGLEGTCDEHYHLSLAAAEDHLSCMAVFDHQNVIVLFCSRAENLERLTDEDRLVLGAVASELVVAVENSRLYKLTKSLAITDELTSLHNYRYLQQRLDDEIERCRRYNKRMSLLMIDVDDFKRFNDTNGHLAGDDALADLGAVMRSVVRDVDVVARYGGEEFSVMLPETDAAGAFVVAEKIREAVANHAFKTVGGARRGSMTVSVGLATFPTHGADKESLLREADDALYNAKLGGKNRVRVPGRRNGPAGEPEYVRRDSSDERDEWNGV